MVDVEQLEGYGRQIAEALGLEKSEGVALADIIERMIEQKLAE
jgi:hypothetical protein